MLVNAIFSVVGFLLAVNYGIVAVAASFVIVGYLLAPISYVAVRKLIKIQFGAYLRQYAAPLLASLFMVMGMMVLKFVINIQGANLYLQLSLYVLTGGLIYLSIIGLTARTLYWQLLEIVSLVWPRLKFKKT